MYIVEEGQFEVLKPEVRPSSVILSKGFSKVVLGRFDQYLFKTACVRTLLPPAEQKLLLLSLSKPRDCFQSCGGPRASSSFWHPYFHMLGRALLC
jgi:hypothetical protein